METDLNPVLISPRLRRALDAGERRAAELGHSYVGCEHILWAMLQDDRGWPRQILKEWNALDELSGHLDELLGDAENRWNDTRVEVALSDAMPVRTPRLARCLRSSAETAKGWGEDGMTTDNLLLAIAEDENGACADLLDRLGLRQRLVEAAKRRLAEDRASCIVVSGDERFLGWPIVEGDQLWIRRPNGKVMHPGDL